MTARLANKIAVVTGSDSGIGQATAIAFAREGANVVVTYHHDQKGAEHTRLVIEQAGRRALVVQLDQQDEHSVARMFEETVAKLGIPDILVNNAGVNLSGQPVAEMSTEVWDKRIKTDLYGPFFCCRAFIGLRRKAGGGGKIVTISSIHEDTPLPGAAGYDAAKGGLRMLTRTLAIELAKDKINVNNIAPGMILTQMNQDAIDNPEVMRKRVEGIPWQRAGKPDDIAKVAVFLTSEDADYVTGQSITVDGGLTVQSE